MANFIYFYWITVDMKEVKTKDGSVTYYNEKVGDHYHSITVGAVEEAFVKYVDQLDAFEGMRVLDFCFGLGYNSYALLTKLEKCEIVGIENDRVILEKIRKIKLGGRYKLIQAAAECGLDGRGYLSGNQSIKILIGDGLEIARGLKGFFDGVMFDPFSPSKAPELWSEEVFSEMYRLMRKGARLVTYSCAGWIRENMKKAGFEVSDGPRFGRRGPTTIAKR